MTHNVIALEEGRANGIIPQDIIIQVDSLAGATLGARGAEALKNAMNKATRCTVVVVRRADRLEEYLAMCNNSTLRSEEHDLQFHPPDVTRLLPDESGADFDESMNMFENEILTKTVEHSSLKDEREREREDNTGGDLAVVAGSINPQSVDDDLAVTVDASGQRGEASTGAGGMPPNVRSAIEDEAIPQQWANIGSQRRYAKVIQRPAMGIERWTTERQMVATGIKLSGVMRHKASDYHI
jgi:hypothetical protein